MKVALHLFASVREAVGQREVCLDLEDGATLDDLKRRLATDFPPLEPMLKTIVFAIDDEYVPFEQRLHDGAEIALIPPVSGGSEDGMFRVTSDVMDPDALV